MCIIEIVTKSENAFFHFIVSELHMTELRIQMLILLMKSSQSAFHENPPSAELLT